MKSMRLVPAAFPGAALLCGLALGLTFASPARADNPSELLHQQQADRLSIFHDYSISPLGLTQADLSGTRGGGLVSPFLGHFASTDTTTNDRPWFISASPIIGYDSNPEGRQQAVDSFFTGFDANATYATDLNPDSPLNVFVSYDMTGAVYEGQVKQANVFQQTGAAGIRHAFFDDTIVTSARISDQFTLEHGDEFLNALDVVPSLEAFWFPQISTEVALDYAHMSFYYPTVQTNNPDTERNALLFNLHLYTAPQTKNAPAEESPDQLTDLLRQTLHSAVIGFGHTWNQGSGSAYKYQSNRIMFGLDGIRPLKTPDLTINFEYAHEWQNYTNEVRVPSPRLNKPFIQFRPKDHLDILTMRVDAHLADMPHGAGSLGGYLQWDWVRDFSFIQTRDFNEYILSTGITYRY